jgi:hypothetical protein
LEVADYLIVKERPFGKATANSNYRREIEKDKKMHNVNRISNIGRLGEWEKQALDSRSQASGKEIRHWKIARRMMWI